jgi:hypothetical protein
VLLGSETRPVALLYAEKAGTWKLVHRLGSGRAWLTSVALSPDGEWALTGSKDGTGRLWSATSGEEIFGYSGEDSGIVRHVAFNPGGDRAVVVKDGWKRAAYLLAGLRPSPTRLALVSLGPGCCLREMAADGGALSTVFSRQSTACGGARPRPGDGGDEAGVPNLTRNSQSRSPKRC